MGIHSFHIEVLPGVCKIITKGAPNIKRWPGFDTSEHECVNKQITILFGGNFISCFACSQMDMSLTVYRHLISIVGIVDFSHIKSSGVADGTFKLKLLAVIAENKLKRWQRKVAFLNYCQSLTERKILHNGNGVMANKSVHIEK